MPPLSVGIAQIDYTPNIGLPLMGNFRDDYAARGVHDPLYARAIVFADAANTKAAILSLDICMLDRHNVALMRNFIAARSDIPPDHVLIAATHTHSAPAPFKLGSLPQTDQHEVKAFLEKAAAAVLHADADRKPAQIGIGQCTETRLAFNRRLRCKDGNTHVNWEQLDPDFVVEPLGPTDPQLTVLSVLRDDRPQAAIVNFGLHPAILAGDNWLYSADYPGYLAQAMARLFGPDFVTLFLNGCCGNVNHLDYADPTQGRGYQMTQRVGYMLAVAAHQAIETRRPLSDGPLAVATRRVPLERIPIDEQQRRWCESVIEDAAKNPTKGQVDGLPDEYYAHARLAMYHAQNAPDEVEVMAIRIGSLAIVGLPGEIFCEFGLNLKENSPAEHTIVLELANDAIGYIPTQQAFEQGGYESTTGTTRYKKGAGDKLVAAAKAQLDYLFPK